MTFILCFTVLQDGVTEESVQQMDRRQGAGRAVRLCRRRYPVGTEYGDAK